MPSKSAIEGSNKNHITENEKESRGKFIFRSLARKDFARCERPSLVIHADTAGSHPRMNGRRKTARHNPAPQTIEM